MKMQYLCAKHCEIVRRDSEQAARLWWGAYNNGVQAYRDCDWQRARAFLGAAYEIMLVRFAFDSQRNPCGLCVEQFAATGRYYANVLCQLRDFEAAEMCLSRVHDGLLHWSGEPTLAYEERITAFEQLAEFRQKLVALLRVSGKGVYAKCADLIARQLAKQVGLTLYH